MPNAEIQRLLLGFKQFREKYYLSRDSRFARMAAGWQGPKTLIIGCCDSRVDPAILSSAGPGELFIVRNVANLVPPYTSDGGVHGVSSAIEFAVINLKVQNIILLGHRQCGGIRALLFPEQTKAGGFLQQWMQTAEPARQRALKMVPADDDAALWKQCELESIRTSIENLRKFPFVHDAVESRGLSIYGLYFDIERGEMLELNESDGTYEVVSV